MIFKFLKYLQPTNYFILPRLDGKYLFPNMESVSSEIVSNLKACSSYKSKIAVDYDRSWQLIQSGYIHTGNNYEKFQTVPIEDEYVFLKRNFSSFWVFYVFMLRILSFYNPFKEIIAFNNCKGIARIKYSSQKINYKDYENFDSPLLDKNPLLSVIIPTLNRYEYLKDVLKDLENQSYKNFEVIVVDQTDPFQETFYQGWKLDLKFWYQEEKALWRARNEAIKSSKGEYVLLYDDDSLVSEDWIHQHIKTLDFFDADISSGISISKVGDSVPDNYSFFKYSDQLDTGNVLIKKSVFFQIGLFDRQFEKQRMGDGEFGLRSYLANFKNISNPLAKRLHLKVSTGGLRQMGLWDAFRPNKWFDPRPIPSVLYLHRKYFGDKFTRYNLLRLVPISLVPYRKKGNKKALIFAYVSILILWPLLFIQIFKSWKSASRKLNEGALIDKLK